MTTKVFAVLLLLLAASALVLAQDTQQTAQDRGLVSFEVTPDAILKESHKYSESAKQRPSQTTLVYVTPWNAEGSENAKTFASKISLVSPVWLQVKSFPKAKEAKKRYSLTGGNNVNVKWMEEMKAANKDAKIVPRVELTHQWSQDDVTNFFTAQKEFEYVKAISKQIMAQVKKHNFDGITLEWGYLKVRNGFDILKKLVTRLSKQLRKDNKILVLVAPAPVFLHKDELKHEHMIPLTAQDMKDLDQYVDYFNIMTYDFTSMLMQRIAMLRHMGQQVNFPPEFYKTLGPIAPQWWCDNVLGYFSEGDVTRASKILLGINFYGQDYAPHEEMLMPNPIVGKDYLDLVKRYEPTIQWNEQAQEHFFEYKDDIGGVHKVFYPSGKSLAERLALARRHGTGVAIWEFGQGLPFFAELL